MAHAALPEGETSHIMAYGVIIHAQYVAACTPTPVWQTACNCGSVAGGYTDRSLNDGHQKGRKRRSGLTKPYITIINRIISISHVVTGGAEVG